jgi:hypothetical protein
MIGYALQHHDIVTINDLSHYTHVHAGVEVDTVYGSEGITYSRTEVHIRPGRTRTIPMSGARHIRAAGSTYSRRERGTQSTAPKM